MLDTWTFKTWTKSCFGVKVLCVLQSYFLENVIERKQGVFCRKLSLLLFDGGVTLIFSIYFLE